jgi:hypothetical protein
MTAIKAESLAALVGTDCMMLVFTERVVDGERTTSRGGATGIIDLRRRVAGATLGVVDIAGVELRVAVGSDSSRGLSVVGEGKTRRQWRGG